MEKQKFSGSRRDFLRTSTIAAAGLAAGSLGPQKAHAAAQAWTDGMQIHPDIDNLRVVWCRDPEMFATAPAGDSITARNDAIDAGQVAANMDEMAKTLTQLGSANSAWAAIFRKPAAKTWAQVRVAIKTNCIEARCCAHFAVVSKVCDELNRLGVPYTSMFIFDAGRDCVGKYGTSYAKENLPAGVTAMNSLGGTQYVSVPGGTNSVSCVGWLTPGAGSNQIDILVNIANNKGHDQTNNNGGLTICMKNHIGTIQINHCPQGGNGFADGVENLAGLFKSDPIIGGDPPRQQLCIVDSLFAMVGGPTGSLTHVPAMLVMGTFAPAIDYLVTKKVRQDIMNDTTMNGTLIDKYLTCFGYTAQERDTLLSTPPGQNGGKGWVEVAPAPPVRKDNPGHGAGPVKTVLIVGPGSSAARVSIGGEERVKEAAVYSAGGRLVLKLRGKGTRFAWDGTGRSGRRVAAGIYVVRVRATRTTATARLVLR